MFLFKPNTLQKCNQFLRVDLHILNPSMQHLTLYLVICCLFHEVSEKSDEKSILRRCWFFLIPHVNKHRKCWNLPGPHPSVTWQLSFLSSSGMNNDFSAPPEAQRRRHVGFVCCGEWWVKTSLWSNAENEKSSDISHPQHIIRATLSEMRLEQLAVAGILKTLLWKAVSDMHFFKGW